MKCCCPLDHPEKCKRTPSVHVAGKLSLCKECADDIIWLETSGIQTPPFLNRELD